MSAIEPGPIILSDLKCPFCGTIRPETMPIDACVIRYDCSCGRTLRPNPGDCCVFCSFGSVPCPPIQAARASGGAGCCSASQEGDA